MKNHALIHTNKEKPFKCDICENSFRSRSDLDRHHGEIHFKGKEHNYECELCDHHSETKRGLAYHLKVHYNRKKLKCNLCNKSYTEKKALNFHLKSHINEKSYKCDICDKELCLPASEHEIIHLGVKKHQCSICCKTFLSSQLLAGHVKRMHTS